MQFINPKTDFAFKRIFGSEQNKDILISFLNGILYEGNSTIKNLEILNPYQAPRIRGVKDTYLDVKAVLDREKTVIIEMQVLNVEGFEKRILYNAAKSYSMQLEIGQSYTLLNPVIALTITDFKMFSNFDKPISRFILKEREFLVDYTIYDLELVFVELPKFTKEIDEVETLTEQWIYFLKSAAQVKEVPEKIWQIGAIRKAFEVANIATLSREELEELEQREMYIIDQRNAIKRAERQAEERGLQKGLQQKSLEIARKLLDVLDEVNISQITGLSLEEVQRLKEER
ncbi:MAG TPA: transposase [Cyanobacteria bacterium UBA11149]|nr:transposase [Cyanobacteria bacterium UBA11367]HBE56648.1 transposase [Cyanobacteria bacterium UBA11366]HBK66348.1 transposase [Cyanobacteria bacterium UBA11166]HBR74113.1 transposase [Cyanobacteria bacterium UBA11159]HBS71359.1 transposase [Cyanobacteria bacterium UBA11153]HBW88235.1 transposase [Cyanobacteria bacterium UBA11149]HCA95105.1 transposase [Cyanobacteria bacterium UBA9226]